jgi:hypothetical protein
LVQNKKIRGKMAGVDGNRTHRRGLPCHRI